MIDFQRTAEPVAGTRRPSRSTGSIVVPMRRAAFVIDGERLHEIEIHALVYDLEAENTLYLATFRDAVADVEAMRGVDVVFEEGTALKIRAQRQRHLAQERAG